MFGKSITVDVDLGDDAMGVENGDTQGFLSRLFNALRGEYPDTDISFTHSGNGRIDLDGHDSGEVHVVNHIINQEWEGWLEQYG